MKIKRGLLTSRNRSTCAAVAIAVVAISTPTAFAAGDTEQSTLSVVQASTSLVTGFVPPTGSGWEPVFDENFNGNVDVLMANGWRNQSSQPLPLNMCAVSEGGVLAVKPKGEAQCLMGHDRPFDPVPHVFAARIRLSRTTGHFDSFWLRNPTSNPYNEVDIVEAYGVQKSTRPCVPSTLPNVTSPTSPDSQWNGVQFNYYAAATSDRVGQRHCLTNDQNRVMKPLDGNYHVFSAEWVPNVSLTFFIDGTKVAQFGAARAVASNVNLALTNKTTGIFANESQHDMLVDWVRVWRKAPPPPAPSAAWFLSDTYGSGTAWSLNYGEPGDIPVVGDWNGDGKDTPGVFRGGQWLLNDDFSYPVEHSISFGGPGDVPVVGDWNGDGRDTIGVVRGDRWLLDNLLQGDANPFPVDLDFYYGTNYMRPVVGDWNGDGRDTPGMIDGITWHLTDSFGGVGTTNFTYGVAGWTPVVGRWAGSGAGDRPGFFDPASATWYLSTDFGGNAEYTFKYGSPWDRPVAGSWKGDGWAKPGVVHGM